MIIINTGNNVLPWLNGFQEDGYWVFGLRESSKMFFLQASVAFICFEQTAHPCLFVCCMPPVRSVLVSIFLSFVLEFVLRVLIMFVFVFEVIPTQDLLAVWHSGCLKCQWNPLLWSRSQPDCPNHGARKQFAGRFQVIMKHFWPGQSSFLRQWDVFINKYWSRFQVIIKTLGPAKVHFSYNEMWLYKMLGPFSFFYKKPWARPKFISPTMRCVFL